MNNVFCGRDRIVMPFSDGCAPNMTAVVSGSGSGNMSLAYGDTREALENRATFLLAAGIDPASLVCACQAHGAAIAVVGDGDRGRGARTEDTAYPGTDALMTNAPDVPLAVFTADCLPVFLYDPRRAVVALVHAGRRGTQAGITGLSLRAMCDAYGTVPADVCAGFGPCIRQCCYEVGPECVAGVELSVAVRDGRFYLDLIDANRRQLLAGGVQPYNVGDCRICTVCAGSGFFSYRREGAAAGRMMSVVMLKKDQ